MIRRVAILVVCFLIAYAVTAWAQSPDPLPRSSDWWDLLYGVIGAVVGWLTRFLQNRISQR